jgi:hypothetical protein
MQRRSLTSKMSSLCVRATVHYTKREDGISCPAIMPYASTILGATRTSRRASQNRVIIFFDTKDLSGEFCTRFSFYFRRFSPAIASLRGP